MPLVVALIVTFATGLVIRLQGKSQPLAWLFSSLVIPVFVLFDAFILAYRGGGASMWPIALVIGSFVGILAGGMGVVAASYYLRKNDNSQSDARTIVGQ